MDANTGLVGIEVGFVQETHIVAGDDRQSKFRCQVQCSRFISLFLFPAAALYLEVEAVWKQAHPVLGQLPCAVRMIVQKCLPNVALAPRGKGDQAIGGPGNPVIAQVRDAVMLAFDVAAAQQLAQAQVACPVLAQQHQPGNMVWVVRVAQQDVGADNGFDAGRLGRAVKFHQCKQVVLIGDRNRRHAQFEGFFNQGLDSNGAVDQRKFSM